MTPRFYTSPFTRDAEMARVVGYGPWYFSGYGHVIGAPVQRCYTRDVCYSDRTVQLDHHSEDDMGRAWWGR